jgi:ketosteroid isomerase-like protein
MEIADFFTIYQDAAWNKDTAAMISLYDEEIEIFDMWEQGYITDAAAWKNVIIDWLGSLAEEKVKVSFERVIIHQSAAVGFASALIQFQAMSKEGVVVRSMKNRITLGFTLRETGWKVFHQHTSAPISGDGLTAILDI